MSDASVYRTIIVTGPYASGKTTFIRTIGEANYAFDPKAWVLYTMDSGRVTIPERQIRLSLLGVPGARRADHLLNVLGADLLGYLILVDSHKPETFREVKSIAETMRSYESMSYLFAANFQDHPDAWTIDDLRVALRIAPEIPMLPCVAIDPVSVADVLGSALTYLWKDGYEQTPDGQ